ncbi:MAG: hypothetical protein ACE5H4_06950 [Candidatus Thorarchaeota archaeon]
MTSSIILVAFAEKLNAAAIVIGGAIVGAVCKLLKSCNPYVNLCEEYCFSAPGILQEVKLQKRSLNTSVKET